jgi:hypothetical protein
MQNDFAVGGCLENRPFAFELVTQQVSVDEIAVVGDGHLPAYAIDHEGLRILDRAGACGRVARVPDGARALQFRQFLLTKDLRNQAHVLVLEKACARAVAGNDPRALLAAMLQREQTVIRQHRRVRLAEHAKEPALVLWECLALRRLRHLGPVWRDHTQ